MNLSSCFLALCILVLLCQTSISRDSRKSLVLPLLRRSLARSKPTADADMATSFRHSRTSDHVAGPRALEAPEFTRFKDDSGNGRGLDGHYFLAAGDWNMLPRTDDAINPVEQHESTPAISPADAEVVLSILQQMRPELSFPPAGDNPSDAVPKIRLNDDKYRFRKYKFRKGHNPFLLEAEERDNDEVYQTRGKGGHSRVSYNNVKHAHKNKEGAMAIGIESHRYVEPSGNFNASLIKVAVAMAKKHKGHSSTAEIGQKSTSNRTEFRLSVVRKLPLSREQISDFPAKSRPGLLERPLQRPTTASPRMAHLIPGLGGKRMFLLRPVQKPTLTTTTSDTRDFLDIPIPWSKGNNSGLITSLPSQVKGHYSVSPSDSNSTERTTNPLKTQRKRITEEEKNISTTTALWIGMGAGTAACLSLLGCALSAKYLYLHYMESKIRDQKLPKAASSQMNFPPLNSNTSANRLDESRFSIDSEDNSSEEELLDISAIRGLNPKHIRPQPRLNTDVKQITSTPVKHLNNL